METKIHEYGYSLIDKGTIRVQVLRYSISWKTWGMICRGYVY